MPGPLFEVTWKLDKASSIAFLLLATAGVAQATMSNDDYASLQTTTRSLADLAAQYDICDIDTDDMLDVLDNALDQCSASDTQSSDIRDLYQKTKASRISALKGAGKICEWPYSDADNHWRDSFRQVRSTLRGVCK